MSDNVRPQLFNFKFSDYDSHKSNHLLATDSNLSAHIQLSYYIRGWDQGYIDSPSVARELRYFSTQAERRVVKIFNLTLESGEIS